jgi:hypothetical protein
MIALLHTKALLGRASLFIITNHLAALHHELHSLQFGNILQRIAGNGDAIRELTLLE